MKNISYPIAVFLYKRPEYTKQLLQLIIDSGIKKIYIFSDGPKSSLEKKIVENVRKIVSEYVKLYPDITFIVRNSSVNNGLKKSIVEGIDTIFKKELAIIVLEDDCIPTSDFFVYMNEMLFRYADESSIMSVAGSGVQSSSEYSYDFSRYQQCWGWGTWKRAWKFYDRNMNGLEEYKWPNSFEGRYWSTMLNLVKKGQVQSWAFIWSFAHIKNHGLAIIPGVNLISNVGFDNSATNTVTRSKLSKIMTQSMEFPLKHPQVIKENMLLTGMIERKYYKNVIAIFGLLRQYLYWIWSKNAHRN